MKAVHFANYSRVRLFEWLLGLDRSWGILVELLGGGVGVLLVALLREGVLRVDDLGEACAARSLVRGVLVLLDLNRDVSVVILWVIILDLS